MKTFEERLAETVGWDAKVTMVSFGTYKVLGNTVFSCVIIGTDFRSFLAYGKDMNEALSNTLDVFVKALNT